MRGVWAAAVVVAVGLAGVPDLRAQPAPNPLKIALKQWGPRIQGGEVWTGSGPFGVAFDGANVWVANNGSNTMSKR